jgi:hypothetical protein
MEEFTKKGFFTLEDGSSSKDLKPPKKNVGNKRSRKEINQSKDSAGGLNDENEDEDDQIQNQYNL